MSRLIATRRNWAEQLYPRRGRRCKFMYIPYGSTINPFFPEEKVTANDNIDVNDSIAGIIAQEVPPQKPISIFAKYTPDDEDFDPDFLKDYPELGILQMNSVDALLQEQENQEKMSELDRVLTKVLSNPKLDFLGKMIAQRRITPESILKFSQREWKRFGIMDPEDRKLIIKYIIMAKENSS